MTSETSVTEYTVAKRGFLGDVGAFRRDPLTYLTNVAQDRADMVFLNLGPYQTVFVNHPDLIEDVLATKGRDFRKVVFLRNAKKILGDGLITNEGERWRTHRKAMQPAFQKERFAAYCESISAFATTMAEGWQVGETRDLYAEAMSLTADILAEIVCGKRLDDEERAMVDRHLLALMRRLTRTDPLRSFFGWLPLASEPEVNRAVQDIRGLAREAIALRRKEPADDIVSLMLQVAQAEGLRDRDIEDEVLTLLAAGHEPSATSLSWLLYLVAMHPGTHDRLLGEWSVVLGERRAGIADVERMPFTEAVVKESLRLFPPGLGMVREAIAHTVVGGHRLAKGTVVFISQWVTQRDPRYFSQPEDFVPERWLDDATAAIPRFAYFPFGGGQRHCVGYLIAMAELQLSMIAICRRFRLTVPADSPLQGWLSKPGRPWNGAPLALEAIPTPEVVR